MKRTYHKLFDQVMLIQLIMKILNKTFEPGP